MILNYLKEYAELLLEAYAKEVLKRPLKNYEKDIFYLQNEFYINQAINKAKDEISTYVKRYIEGVEANENSSNRPLR